MVDEKKKQLVLNLELKWKWFHGQVKYDPPFHQSSLPQSLISLHCNDSSFYRNFTLHQMEIVPVLLCGRHLTNSHNGKFSRTKIIITRPPHNYSTNCSVVVWSKRRLPRFPKDWIRISMLKLIALFQCNQNQTHNHKKKFRIKTHNLNRFVGPNKKKQYSGWIIYR